MIIGGVTAETEKPEKMPLSEIVFFVHWYSVGKAALEGLPGIHKVTSGFQGFREINTVNYDPRVISPDQMISALKSAGTYIGVAQNE